MLCLAMIESAFEINNIKKGDVTMLHALWLGEIPILHRHGKSLVFALAEPDESSIMLMKNFR